MTTGLLADASARARLAVVAMLFVVLPAAPAHAQYVWPEDGAPLCLANGDQHGLFMSVAECGAIKVGSIHSAAGTDSLTFAFVNPLPPTGACHDFFVGPVDATGVTEVNATQVYSPYILGIPGCFVTQTATAWLQGAGSTQQLVVQTDAWLGFGVARQVVDDGDFVRSHPRVVGSGLNIPDTALAVVWSDERSGVPQIRAQRIARVAGRSWGASGIAVAPTSAAQTSPEIARLDDGSTLVVWLDARSGGTDVYAQKLLADGSVAPGWPADGLALEDRAEISGGLRLVSVIALGTSGFVVWEESGARFGGGRSVVVRKLLSDGMPDPAWNALGVVLTSSTTVEHLEDVSAADLDLVAVWTDTRSAAPGNPTDLYAQWLEPAGTRAAGWPEAGLALCTATGRQGAARVSAWTYAAFAWEDERGADVDVYAELRQKNGALPPGLWVPDGLPATSAAGAQSAPVVGVGNSGGCFVVWEDARNLETNGLDLYAQAFSIQGEKLDAPAPAAPSRVLLSLPKPNPMRSSSVFTLEVPRTSAVRVEIVDLAGRRVRTIAHGTLEAGVRSLTFDGRDDAGRDVPPGVYRVHARVGDATTSRTLIRVR